MQQVKTCTPGLFKRLVRNQLEKDIKVLAKDGWHLQTLIDQGVGDNQLRTGRLTAVYTK